MVIKMKTERAAWSLSDNFDAFVSEDSLLPSSDTAPSSIKLRPCRWLRARLRYILAILQLYQD